MTSVSEFNRARSAVSVYRILRGCAPIALLVHVTTATIHCEIPKKSLNASFLVDRFVHMPSFPFQARLCEFLCEQLLIRQNCVLFGGEHLVWKSLQRLPRDGGIRAGA
jgi:hypothetical protein